MHFPTLLWAKDAVHDTFIRFWTMSISVGNGVIQRHFCWTKSDFRHFYWCVRHFYWLTSNPDTFIQLVFFLAVYRLLMYLCLDLHETWLWQQDSVCSSRLSNDKGPSDAAEGVTRSVEGSTTFEWPVKDQASVQFSLYTSYLSSEYIWICLETGSFMSKIRLWLVQSPTASHQWIIWSVVTAGRRLNFRPKSRGTEPLFSALWALLPKLSPGDVATSDSGSWRWT
jgi:hypothetical protein